MQPSLSRFRGASETAQVPLQNKPKTVAETAKSSSKGAVILFLVAVVLVFFVAIRWINGASLIILTSWSQPAIDTHSQRGITTSTQQSKPQTKQQPKPISFACPMNQTTTPICQRAASPYQASSLPLNKNRPPPSCPEYFRWIHEDLRPWSSTGITKEMVESAQPLATFRLVVLDGRVYYKKYRPSFLTRDVFTLWGILQLVYLYPGLVPDLDIMFNCDDLPSVKIEGYRASTPPPLFHYCKDDATLDIPFPDWSFWGWPEINIKPWVKLSEELKQANEIVKWKDREPYAFWKGNFKMGGNRVDLLRCNASISGQEWNARLYDQNWVAEVHGGFKTSSLANQCRHRYKIFVEGVAWSVSQKYILACDSPTLLITTRFYEFFQRGLKPGRHFWPIPENDKCNSIKFAVDWGNNHQEEAEAMGKAGSGFVQEDLKMDYVYDYMLHSLTQYGKMLRYKPTIPEQSIELCLESMACTAEGRVKEFMEESMVKYARDGEPCTLPPPFSPQDLQELLAKNAESAKRV